MSSVRLTMSLRDEIIDKLVKGSIYTKKIKELSDKVSEMAEEVLETCFDKKLMELFRDEKYSGYFLSNTMNLKWGKSWGEEVRTKKEFPNSKCCAKDLISNKSPEVMEEIEKLLSEIATLQHQRTTFKNKLRCSMENYRTSKQLKEDFPEAYKCLLELNGVSSSVATSNKCDQIEEIRAILSETKDETK